MERKLEDINMTKNELFCCYKTKILQLTRWKFLKFQLNKSVELRKYWEVPKLIYLDTEDIRTMEIDMKEAEL